MDNEILQREIQANFSKASLEAYDSIRDSYLKELKGKYDSIREEICTCIVFRCFQAALTLTNHLLELLLKDSLIFNECGFAKIDSSERFEIYSSAVDLFDSLTLNETINKSCEAQIITPEEKTKLHEFRRKFRNAYGHAEKKKIFEGQDPIRFVVGRLDGTIPLQSDTTAASNFFLLHGIMQSALASNDAVPYFLYVDAILYREEIKWHPEILERPERFQRHFKFRS